jgi:hypothetical protein
MTKRKNSDTGVQLRKSNRPEKQKKTMELREHDVAFPTIGRISDEMYQLVAGRTPAELLDTTSRRLCEGDVQNGLRNYLQIIRQSTDPIFSRDIRSVRVSNILLRLHMKCRSANVNDVDNYNHNCIQVVNRNNNSSNNFTVSNSYTDLAFWVQTLRGQYIWPHQSQVRFVIDAIAREFYNPNDLVPPVGSVVVFPLALTMYNSTNRQWIGGHANFAVFKKITRTKWRWFIIEPHTPDPAVVGFYQTVWMNVNHLFSLVNDSLGGVNTLLSYGNLRDFNTAPNTLTEIRGSGNPNIIRSYRYQYGDSNNPRPFNVGAGYTRLL